MARLATVGPAGQPHLVPVTFALDGDFIYTVVDAKPKTTTDLRRLRNIEADPRIAVLATTMRTTGMPSGGPGPTGSRRYCAIPRTWPARWNCWRRATASTGRTRQAAR